MLRDEQVFQQSHPTEEADVLECARDTRFPINIMAGEALEQHFLPVWLRQRDHALGRFVKTGDAIEHGGLASAVRSDQRCDLPGMRFEAEIANGGQPAKAHGEMIDFEKGRAHQP